jgi:hypothetical protein
VRLLDLWFQTMGLGVSSSQPRYSNLTFSILLNVLLHIVICTRLPANFGLDPAFCFFWVRRTGSRESDSFGLPKFGFNDPGS